MTPAIAEPKSPEQIVAAAQAAREESLEAYYTLAHRVATGEDVDPAEVSRIATLAGKPLEENPGEFTALIAAFQHRHRLRESRATRTLRKRNDRSAGRNRQGERRSGSGRAASSAQSPRRYKRDCANCGRNTATPAVHRLI